ncbi:hypothetical protein OG407_21935 [Streptomyces sp. NBC_01515]|uniref:hypothetical protein n=1 Tax=Streptomyces sp. NBC_01515 TaxID=2903890 RepID=UPI00386F6A88
MPAAISTLAQTGDNAPLTPGLAALADDLTTGRWHARYTDLLTRDTVDVGYRLLVAGL